jgi:hypothetical protein
MIETKAPADSRYQAVPRLPLRLQQGDLDRQDLQREDTDEKDVAAGGIR